MPMKNSPERPIVQMTMNQNRQHLRLFQMTMIANPKQLKKNQTSMNHRPKRLTCHQMMMTKSPWQWLRLQMPNRYWKRWLLTQMPMTKHRANPQW